jgi:hypothetical protein
VDTFRSQGAHPLPQIQRPAELRVSRAELPRMERAAAVVADCRARLGAGGRNILCEVAPPADAIVEWRHYPEGEVYDPASHAQYFYHAHPVESRLPHEHGHFHTFLRAEGMPFGVAPLLWPEAAVAEVAVPHSAPLKRGQRDEVSHLVAVSLDARGEPIRLFTTNRWVTGETWYPADDVIAMLDRFVMTAVPSRLADRWLVAVMQLFRPQIAALLRRRDETVTAWRRRRRANVFEDPRLEITSSLEIDLGAQLAFIERFRSETAAADGPPTPSLPRMAEGWDETRPE